VPELTENVGGRPNRYWSSYEISAVDESRAAPEYVNIRHEVVRSKLKNLNTVPNKGTPPSERFDHKIDKGGYEAAHFLDSTCDGTIKLRPPTALKALESFCSYSLVTAIDYFPLVDQAEIEEWLEAKQGRAISLSQADIIFSQGGPKPLSDGRFELRPVDQVLTPVITADVPNQNLPDPGRGVVGKAFPALSVHQTITAVISRAARGGPTSESLDASDRAIVRVTTWLPDGASDIFAPGWDVSRQKTSSGGMYVSYGLGSPFPEDAKLCAALNSFWPAVSPDSSRTYGYGPSRTIGQRRLPTAIPLLDSELGYHADHPRTKAKEVKSVLGWDGDNGPFIQKIKGSLFVNAANPARSDQVQAAIQGKLGFSGLNIVSGAELIQRIEDLLFCKRTLSSTSVGSDSWLVTAEKVDNWSTWNSSILPRAEGEAGMQLAGSGFIFVFARVQLPPMEDGDPPMRLLFQVFNTAEFQLSSGLAFWKVDGGPFKVLQRRRV
jgi:hypothetical protein